MKRLSILLAALAAIPVLLGQVKPLPTRDVRAVSTVIIPTKAASDAVQLFSDAKEYGALTNLVELLVRSGEFCRIRHHAFTPSLKGYSVDQIDKPEWRVCLVCGREEERANKEKSWHQSNP